MYHIAYSALAQLVLDKNVWIRVLDVICISKPLGK